MKHFIQQRCDDYKENQAHMIDSILNRKRRCINIDSILVNDELELDPQIIMKETNKHYQTVAGSEHSYVPIPTEWKDDFEPLTSINEGIYDELMAPITIQEWS